ncbi:hypothetical protein IAR55_006039 [Kwoniella newhampshirensis]|uniref:C2H2-type domain-containing protein n=1 Tax=Kwoniella newhampshirensis TaxID=1651941 RepID=A0AAW0YUD7_9TREE
MSSSQLRTKRPRSISSSSISSAPSLASTSTDDKSESDFDSQPIKYHRAPSPTHKPYSCTLPPTCSQPGTSTSYTTEAQLARHQDTFHRWICRVPIRDREGENRLRNNQKGLSPKGKGKEEADTGKEAEKSMMVLVPEGFVGGRGHRRWKECLKVFPDERLLDLHYTETHDPIARERGANGEKIFQCFLLPGQCGKNFLDPKRRRRHMIDKHKYPRQYFFAITNHGLNDIVRQDGLAISLIRPRKEFSSQAAQAPKLMEEARTSDQSATVGQVIPALDEMDTNNPPIAIAKAPDVDMDDLVTQMASSLTFVPRGVRKAAKAKQKEKMELVTD